MFFKALKLTNEYENDPAMGYLVDGADKFMSKKDGLQNAWDLGTKIGLLIGDITVGGEDMISRLLEISAVYDIGKALKAELWNTQIALQNTIGTSHKKNSLDNKIDRYIELSQYLVGIRLRGEYCFCNLMSKDIRLLAWFNKGTAEQVKDNYRIFCMAFDGIQNKLAKIKETDVSIKGKVVDTEGSLIEGVEVTICDQSKTVRASLISNQDGIFETELDFIGYCTIAFSKEGYDSSQIEGKIVLGQNNYENQVLTPTVVLDDSYILPESDSRVYTIKELSGLSKEELELARNEIFARRGRIFKREDLQQYFEGKFWYLPCIEPDEFDDQTMLSDVEKENLILINELETKELWEVCYDAIINEYREAVAIDHGEWLKNESTYQNLFSNIYTELIGIYHRASVYEYEEPFGIGYTYYDIDQNGIPELIIIDFGHELYYDNIYSFDGTEAVKLNLYKDNRAYNSCGFVESGIIYTIEEHKVTYYRLEGCTLVKLNITNEEFIESDNGENGYVLLDGKYSVIANSANDNLCTWFVGD